MLRKGNTRPFHWADKTMSVLRANQLEACEKDLAGLPSFSLFDNVCTDANIEELYDLSWYAVEDRSSGVAPKLHSAEELRVRVLSSFPAESALLSPEEHELMIRLILCSGQLVLPDWNDLIPARSLIRRLWCRGEWNNGNLVLHMPHQLCATALIMIAGDAHKAVRDIVDQVLENTDNTLYLVGIMQASAPLMHLESLLKDTVSAGRKDLMERLLRSVYDYVYGPDGRMLLIHPGLADPDRMMVQMSDMFRSAYYQEISSETLNKASSSMMDLESPLYDRMLSSLIGAVRPELTPEDAVEDLIILAKQGVSLSDMKEVLSSMLVSIPTHEMLKSLECISGQIPRWLLFSSSRVQ